MRALRTTLLLAVVVAVVAAIATWTCPAGFAYRFVADSLRPLTLHDIGGTIWSGHAGRVGLLGRDIGALDWQLQPVALLHGEIASRFVLAGTVVAGSGTVRHRDARTEFDNVVLRMPARVAAPVLGIPALELLGTLEIDIGQARLDGMKLETASGTAHWRNAEVAGAAQARIGDLQATFRSTPDGGIAGVVHDLGGPLEASGTFSARLGRYAAQIRLAARDGNRQVAEALQYVGQPQPDGSRDLQIRGRQLNLFGS